MKKFESRKWTITIIVVSLAVLILTIDIFFDIDIEIIEPFFQLLTVVFLGYMGGNSISKFCDTKKDKMDK